jgi:hypothetical protein
MCEVTRVRPVVDRVVALPDVRQGFERLLDDDLFGKVVVQIG